MVDLDGGGFLESGRPARSRWASCPATKNFQARGVDIFVAGRDARRLRAGCPLSERENECSLPAPPRFFPGDRLFPRRLPRDRHPSTLTETDRRSRNRTLNFAKRRITDCHDDFQEKLSRLFRSFFVMLF
jgi:hypothetical protein